MSEIGTAYASGYKYILLEAPTGFGKSPVAVTVALNLGSSYICTATKDLQAQYARDFSFIKVAKGKNNFICAVKEDFIRNGTYKCGLCNSNNEIECYHTTAHYGSCTYNEDFQGHRCKYITSLGAYQIRNQGTKEEEVFLDTNAKNYYENEYFQWVHIKNLKARPIVWRPCDYFDRLNVALTSSHSAFNYPMFLSHLAKEHGLQSRDLLILDEVHLLESEIVKFREISISKRKWKKYIPDLRIDDYGNDVENWVDFLKDLEGKMIDIMKNISEELAIEAMTDTNRLSLVVSNIRLNPEGWVVSDIKKMDNEVISVEFKPLDVSPYCQGIFEKCNKVLMMSATILDKDAFCKSLGLVPEDVKFIQVPSEFPLQNRPIHPLNVAYLNSESLQQQGIQIKIAMTIDNLMTVHRNHKGIIHTTSYKQVDFIIENIPQTNQYRLLRTDPSIPREEIIAEHRNSPKPTVLISPSLYLGLDLKDDLSRFQIITKVPYPDLGDRWINEKRKINRQWYTWQTALRLVQGYGRSIRSKEDWAKTYVLDTAFEYFVKKNRNILPGWFVQAIRPNQWNYGLRMYLSQQ